MSEEGNAGDSGAPDPITQLKGETTRKLDSLNSEISELKKATSVLVEALSRPQPRAAAKADDAAEDLTTLMYSDPERYTAVIQERATKAALGTIGKQQEAQQRTNQVLAELSSEYPEINDQTSPLTKKAVEIYSALSEQERNSTLSYKLAVKEAAAELGVKPRSKRTEEEFIGSGSARGDGTRRVKAEKLDPGTQRWADLLLTDEQKADPGLEARLIERSKRKWSTYQKPLTTKKKGAK